MTIREAVDRGVRRLRAPEWNVSAYLEFPPLGPWVILHDEISTPRQTAHLLITELIKDVRADYEEVLDAR